LPLPDNLIVTPFAQILHSLRTVRNNYVAFTSLSPDQLQQSKLVCATFRSLLHSFTSIASYEVSNL